MSPPKLKLLSSLLLRLISIQFQSAISQPPHFPPPNPRLVLAYIALQALKHSIVSDPNHVTLNWDGPHVCNYTGIFCAPAPDAPSSTPSPASTSTTPTSPAPSPTTSPSSATSPSSTSTPTASAVPSPYPSPSSASSPMASVADQAQRPPRSVVHSPGLALPSQGDQPQDTLATVR